MLSPRQERLYQHRLTVWRKTETRDGSSNVVAAWAIVTSAVPAYFQTGQSQKSPHGFALEESDSLLVLDKVHMEQNVDVEAGDCLKQTTGPDAPAFYMVIGDPQKRTLHANKQLVLCSRTPHPPEGVS